MAITENEVRQGREAKERYKQLQRAQAWAEYLLARRQQFLWQCRRNVSDTDYVRFKDNYERLWEREWHYLERKLLNGSGVPSMVKRQLGESVVVKIEPPRAMYSPMPEYVDKKLPTIEELEEEYGVNVSDDSEE